MGYPQYQKAKTDTTTLIWAAHLASLLIDTMYSASKLRTTIKFNGTVNRDFRAFINNFDELFESTKNYLNPQDLTVLELEELFGFEMDSDLNYIKKLLKAFFDYNILIHKSKLMRLIEEASVFKDDGL